MERECTKAASRTQNETIAWRLHGLDLELATISQGTEMSIAELEVLFLQKAS